MKSIRTLGLCVLGIAAIGGLGHATSANSTPLPDDRGHRSSLPITLTMLNGVETTVTLEGVGCRTSMCSRVRVRNTTANNVWLDGVASVRSIQDTASGTVKAIFDFKNGGESQESVVAGNRVLYVKDGHGRQQKLDLGDISRISFLR
jgi:hypothetical protein